LFSSSVTVIDISIIIATVVNLDLFVNQVLLSASKIMKCYSECKCYTVRVFDRFLINIGLFRIYDDNVSMCVVDTSVIWAMLRQ